MILDQKPSSQDTISRVKTKAIAKPPWLKVKAPGGANFLKIKETLASHKLHTVCEEARCPNIGECWAGGTATFMLLGDTCTRGCKFCNVITGNPRGVVDSEEPAKIALSVADMNLDYIVLTSVDRDDLPDQGATHFADTVRLVKRLSPKLIIETLTPDWRGSLECIDTMAQSSADVLAHNIETVENLQRRVRDPRCSYAQSLMVLEQYKKRAENFGRKVVTKSSIMLGLGEKESEVLQTLQDLLNVGVEVLTLGQYLQPSSRHLPVEAYISPEKFSEWAKIGEDLGFAYVASGPLVRSSYKAGEYYIQKILRGERSHGNLLGPEHQYQQTTNVISSATL
ncbi:MAG: lipoyl synthase [Proteobacteria bacterium]|nr:lipoyl synthase [Pseudomonadota bacterium]